MEIVIIFLQTHLGLGETLQVDTLLQIVRREFEVQRRVHSEGEATIVATVGIHHRTIVITRRGTGEDDLIITNQLVSVIYDSEILFLSSFIIDVDDKTEAATDGTKAGQGNLVGEIRSCLLCRLPLLPVELTILTHVLLGTSPKTVYKLLVDGIHQELYALVVDTGKLLVAVLIEFEAVDLLAVGMGSCC